jgi:general secretion pathway protein L
MLKEILIWWAERMREMLPARLRARDGRPADALVVETAPGAPDLRLFRRRRGRETGLGEVDAAALPARLATLRRGAAGEDLVLRLAPSDRLEREVTLPLVAEADLDRVLGYEMDRLTPFAAAEVFWTAAVTRRDRDRQRLVVRLVLVPRAGLQPVLVALAAAGSPATTIEAPIMTTHVPKTSGGATGWAVITLARTARTIRRRRATAALAVVCAMLGVAVIVTPLLRQSLALDDVETRIAALRPRVDAADGLRRRIAAAQARIDVVAAQRARSGDALAALAALTDILPDDTYLTELSLVQRRLMLRGQSAGAARLIGLLAADPALRNPIFVAPVVRNEAGHTDLFSLQAEIAPPMAAPPMATPQVATPQVATP